MSDWPMARSVLGHTVGTRRPRMMRYVLAAAVLALLAQAPRVHAVPEILVWCVASTSPTGQREYCSPVREAVRAEMLRRWDASNGWDRDEGMIITRVQ